MEVKEIFKNSDETALLLELEKILEKIKDKDLGDLPQYPTIFSVKHKFIACMNPSVTASCATFPFRDGFQVALGSNERGAVTQ